MDSSMITRQGKAAAIGIVALGATAFADAPSSGQELVKTHADGADVTAVDLTGHGGAENWQSLTVMSGGDVLAGLSSRKGSGVLVRIASAAEDPQIETVMRLDEVGNLLPDQRQPKIHVTPRRGPDGRYWFLSHFGMDSHLPLYGSRMGYEGGHLWSWAPERRGQDHGLVRRGSGAVGMALAEGGDVLYASTFPQAQLLRIEIPSGRQTNLGRTNGVYAPRRILVDPRGRPWVTDHKGRFWFSPLKANELRKTGAHLEASGGVPGKLLAQGLVASAVFDKSRSRYLATSAWGELYSITFHRGDSDFEEPEVESLGKPMRLLERQPQGPAATIAALAHAPDGWVYLGVSGYNQAVDSSGDSYILRCRPDGTKPELIARLDGRFASYLVGCQAVDVDAKQVYFAASHLEAATPHLIVIELPSEPDEE
jgi:hypothetical protein